MLRSSDGLRAFCDDLASPEPSPGGGTASAAAGAMAASLLSMVCGITLKSKRHEQDWPRLAALKADADGLASRLVGLAGEDAAAYDAIVESARARRKAPGDHAAEEAYGAAVRRAMEVPMSTAEACVRVLALSQAVASSGTRSASSDVEVARLLAGAGVEGAVANVLVNLPSCEDAAFGSAAKARAEGLRRDMARLLAP